MQKDSASPGRRSTSTSAKKAYVAVFGYQKFPFLTSDRIDQSALVE